MSQAIFYKGFVSKFGILTCNMGGHDNSSQSTAMLYKAYDVFTARHVRNVIYL